MICIFFRTFRLLVLTGEKVAEVMSTNPHFSGFFSLFFPMIKLQRRVPYVRIEKHDEIGVLCKNERSFYCSLVLRGPELN